MTSKSFRMAYHENNNGLKIAIPNSIRFPCSIAHVERRDNQTFAIYENPIPNRTTPFTLCPDYNDARFILISHTKNIGPHFRIMEILHRVDDDGALVVEVPDEDHRRRPVYRRTKQLETTKRKLKGDVAVIPEEPGADCQVLVDWEGRTLEFTVPINILAQSVFTWIHAGYGEKFDDKFRLQTTAIRSSTRSMGTHS